MPKPTTQEAADLFVQAEIQKTDKGMLAIASTSVLDRQDEVIDQNGWEIKNFKKNPVLQWAHNHEEPAIGKAKNVRVEGTGKRAKLLFEPEFHQHTPMAKALSAMVDDGIINSFSVGYKPIEMEGNTYTKQELLEISLVNVPANPEARMLAYKSLKKAGFDESKMEKLHILTTEDIDKGKQEEPEDEEDRQVTETEEETKAKEREIEDLKDQVKRFEQQMEDVVNGLKHLNPRGRKSEIITARLALNKVVARATDKLFEEKSVRKQVSLLKVIKRANEKLIVDQKQELKANGKN